MKTCRTSCTVFGSQPMSVPCSVFLLYLLEAINFLTCTSLVQSLRLGGWRVLKPVFKLLGLCKLVICLITVVDVIAPGLVSLSCQPVYFRTL